MKVAQVINSNTAFKRVPFKLSDVMKAHESSGCYVLSNFDDEVIYIGQSVNLRRRMQEHLNNPRMTGMTRLGFVAWFCYELWGAGKIAHVESDMLMNYWLANKRRLPPLNRQLAVGGLFR